MRGQQSLGLDVFHCAHELFIEGRGKADVLKRLGNCNGQIFYRIGATNPKCLSICRRITKCMHIQRAREKESRVRESEKESERETVDWIEQYFPRHLLLGTEREVWSTMSGMCLNAGINTALQGTRGGELECMQQNTGIRDADRRRLTLKGEVGKSLR